MEGGKKYPKWNENSRHSEMFLRQFKLYNTYMTLILSGKYRFLLPAVIPPRVWTVGRVRCVNKIYQPMGCGNWNLSGKKNNDPVCTYIVLGFTEGQRSEDHWSCNSSIDQLIPRFMSWCHSAAFILPTRDCASLCLSRPNEIERFAV